jgi:hypothetical protein
LNEANAGWRRKRQCLFARLWKIWISKMRSRITMPTSRWMKRAASTTQLLRRLPI